MLRLLLHPRWLEQAGQDVPLTRAEFHAAYGSVFPGAVCTDLGPLMAGMVWRA